MKKGRAVIAGLVLAVVLLQVALAVVVAQEAPPPTWKPPEIYKTADRQQLKVGESVRFTIIVRNPGTPGVDASWYSVRVTDDVDPALRIDAVSTTRGSYTISGQRVVVDGGITLAPGEQFSITIDCTLVGPIEEGQVLINDATLEYEDEEGNPQPPIDVDEPVEIIIEEEIPPVIPEASTLFLLGSAATGLAGYVGLQIRARRQKGG